MTVGKSLLPDGISDNLFPNAKNEANIGNKLLLSFESFGYERINPSLLEFEDSLLSGNGKTNAKQTFRVMDPNSNRMMGIRTDMTSQIGRIASYRLVNKKRPLRLMYGGDVLRVSGSTTRPQRQFKQYGVELIGVDSAYADAEVIKIATTALINAGVKNISIDICLPKLPLMCAKYCNIDFSEIKDILEKRDNAAFKSIGGDVATMYTALLSAQGEAKKSIKKLEPLPLKDDAKSLLNRAKDVLEILESELPDSINITLDACETKGFQFQSGIGFTLFSKSSRGELGRGGRYTLNDSDEASVGFSLYSDTLATAIDTIDSAEKIYAKFNEDKEILDELRASGKIVISALGADDDIVKTAQELGCNQILENGKINKI